MNRIEAVLAIGLVVVGCSDSRPASPNQGGAGGDAPPVGGVGGSSEGGGGMEATGGMGATGSGGAGAMAPEGGGPAVDKWLEEACGAMMEDGCPPVYPDPEACEICFCSPSQVEVLPDMISCAVGRIETVCVARVAVGGGGCSTSDCPAEPAENSYIFRERPSGEVELFHRQPELCGWTAPPIGFTECQMKDTDPETCICRCEL